MIRHLGFRPPLTAVICYLNQAIIPICTVATLIYPPLLTTIRGTYFPRLTKSRWGMPARRAPDRLAALLTAFRLVYRVLPAPDFHRRVVTPLVCNELLIAVLLTPKRLESAVRPYFLSPGLHTARINSFS